jgi:hypothetical protein
MCARLQPERVGFEPLAIQQGVLPGISRRRVIYLRIGSSPIDRFLAIFVLLDGVLPDTMTGRENRQ